MTRPPGAAGRIQPTQASFGRMGIHFQLTGGHRTPAAPEEVRSLVTPEGVFARKRMDIGEVAAGETAPGSGAPSLNDPGLRGRTVAHGHHHHVHKRPDVFGYLEFARELGIRPGPRIRTLAAKLRAAGVRAPTAFISGSSASDLSPGRLWTS
jgi:hypothetical protein